MLLAYASGFLIQRAVFDNSELNCCELAISRKGAKAQRKNVISLFAPLRLCERLIQDCLILKIAVVPGGH